MNATQDDRFRILEMHVNLDLKGFEHTDKKGRETGIALPYVVTIEKGTRTILAIRRNWYEDDILHTKRQHFVHYQYIPGFGFYGYGLIHLIGGYAKSATMLIRQLVDAGTLSNLPGGLKSRGLRIKGDDTPIQPGEFRDVDVPSGSIRDNILPLPYKEPSQVLMALFQQIVQEGRAFASSGDMNVSDMSNEAPVGTTLAILERTLKVVTAVQARLHYTMKQEFKLLKVIIADYTPEEYDYEPEDANRKAKKSDYDSTDVIPVSDPNAATMAQKIVTYQAVLQLAQQAPQLYDLALLHRQMIEVLGVKNADKLVKTEDDAEPTDPIQENQDILTHKPVKAFMEQNQENGEKKKRVPPEMADQIAIKAAQAAQQLLQQNQQEAQQQAAQQKLQDPIVQMQMQELQLKQQDLQLKAQKQQVDAAEKADRIRVEESRIQAQMQIAAMQVGAQSAAAKDKAQKQQQAEGLRMGIDAAKHKAQMAVQMAQQRSQQNKKGDK